MRMRTIQMQDEPTIPLWIYCYLQESAYSPGIESSKFHTAIAAEMAPHNELVKQKSLDG